MSLMFLMFLACRVGVGVLFLRLWLMMSTPDGRIIFDIRIKIVHTRSMRLMTGRHVAGYREMRKVN